MLFAMVSVGIEEDVLFENGIVVGEAEEIEEEDDDDWDLDGDDEFDELEELGDLNDWGSGDDDADAGW